MHDPNIAPQHIFDGVHLADHGFGGSPSLPPLNLGQPSPTNLDAAGGYEALVAANTNLRTRVSELEVINMVYSDNENSLRTERDVAVRERDDLKRRVEELEKQLQQPSEDSRPNKRVKLTDDATEPVPAEAAPAVPT
jgi:GATA-binding protein, other eukaryote